MPPWRDTKHHAQSWPKEGRFDEDIVEHTLTYMRSKYQKKKRKRREAILSLWQVFGDTKTNVKSTGPEKAATQAQEKPPEKALEEPPPYALYPILPEDGTDVKGAGEMPCPVPTAPLVGHETKRSEREITKLQPTREQAERSRSPDPLRGQWTTGRSL
ncbi:hypothetical protein NDU88_005114 [Pleurodeles waltl]|uniref:Uncharacterized protein n=1 Tax=Pleurodeles waltl TaxID=8319 RepID=A0AAV7QK31_PLEWA|nr:hypothetical protein NDU88_005114 [Pleurodeles waltl]